jgi:AAA domain, putative AbiEii toxin, Type IV TA system
MAEVTQKTGSIWRRWDPHIHAPGTIFNDQFTGVDPWGNYLDQIEKSTPAIEALGITDYYSLDVYEQTRAWKNQGRLPNVGLIFPNVEMRYAVGTSSSMPVNFHILISPDDPDHVNETKRFLDRLTFKHQQDTLRCNRGDIIRLGRAHTGSTLDDSAAFKEGANQFKVEVDAFLKEWSDCPWIQKNALIAVAGSNKDGSAGLQNDASLAALRQKIESAAHIIFASQPKQRAFWLGQGVLPADELTRIYGGFKPCLHGSDAHMQENVGVPDKDRYCWIKGDATFETLRQACMEPDIRAMVSAEVPSGSFASQTIASLTMKNSSWFGSEPLSLNSGLVGVIGARGSGKTALADMIAAGSYSLSAHANNKSFVRRAKDFLVDSKAVLDWADGSQTQNDLASVDTENMLDSPRVQYLSQQFVEQLCASDGASDELVSEIERVIFSTHPKESRLGAENFRELLGLTASRSREARGRHEKAIAGIGFKIGQERNKQDAVSSSKSRRQELEESIKKDKADREKLVPVGAEVHSQNFSKVAAAADIIRQRIEQGLRRKQALGLLKDHVNDFRTRISVDDFDELKTRHAAADIQPSDWPCFKTDFVGRVDEIIATAEANANALILRLEGQKEQSPDVPLQPAPQTASSLAAGAELTALPLSVLAKEEDRLRALIGEDDEKRRRHAKLTDKIRDAETSIRKLDGFISAGEAAAEEITRLLDLRTKSYEGVFEGIVAEEIALSALYQPISEKLKISKGALGKLTFSIRRIVDIPDWAARGEKLIDKRKVGDFKGLGALLGAAEAELGHAWRKGNASEVAKAMAAFRSKYDETLRAGTIVDKADVQAWREWGGRVSEWLYGTEHIRVAYSIQYEGVELQSLSPGTRGIVLLLLYLAIDTEDDRPLIIDQPEENLDPKSVYEELVGLFRGAKQRRQIIIVTHNANLIINTDADQVIVAECGTLKPNALPDITYTSGALEDPIIRKHVCDILEGGERAFRERAKRLRVNLS